MATVSQHDPSFKILYWSDDLAEKMAQIEKDQHHNRPEKGELLAQGLHDAFSIVQANLAKNIKVDGSALVRVSERAESLQQLEHVKTSLKLFSVRTDISDLIDDYAHAFSSFQRGCDVSYNGRVENEQEESQSYDAQLLLRDSKSGDVNCDTLRDDIFNLYDQIDAIERMDFHSPFELYLGGYLAPNQVRQFDELSHYQTHYFSSGLFAGTFYRLSTPDWIDALQGTGPLMELHYNYISGDDSNLGSHRHLAEARLGWKQYAFEKNFLAIRGGAGLSLNWLNFGKGFPLEEQTSLMTSTQASVGRDFCLNTESCFALEGGVFYQGTVAGEPDYSNRGALVSLTFLPNLTGRGGDE